MLVLLFNIGLVLCLIWALSGFWNYSNLLLNNLPEFVHWFLKGVLVPVVGWLLVNAGFCDALPPLVSRSVHELPSVLAAGIWVVFVFWGTVTLGWQLGFLIRNADRRHFIISAVFCSFVLCAFFLCIPVFRSPMGGCLGLMIGLFLLCNFALSRRGVGDETPRPSYITALPR